MSERESIIASWEALYTRYIPPLVGEDEKTVGMIALETGLDPKTAQNKIDEMLRDGVIVSAGMRRTGKGPECEAYKVVKENPPG